MGRPPKRTGERLSKNRTFRVRAGLDDQLIDAAESSRRSVSEEIEHRLEKSFAGESVLDELRAHLHHIEDLLALVAVRVGVKPPAAADKPLRVSVHPRSPEEFEKDAEDIARWIKSLPWSEKAKADKS